MRTFLLLLVLAAGPLRAGELLLAGPEVVVGSSDLVPWQAGPDTPPALATDGDETVAVWSNDWFSARGSLYALRIDREGRPIGAPRLLVARGTGSGIVRVLWVDGLYLVFHTDTNGKLAVLRMTRELEIVDRRWPGLDAPRFDVAASADEIVAISPSGLLRLRRDLSVIGEVAFRAPERAAVAITAAPHGFSIVIAHTPAILAQQLRGSRLGSPVRIAPVGTAGDAAIIWTGSEYAAVWLSCSAYGCWEGGHVEAARLDPELQTIGVPVAVSAVGSFQCVFCDDVLHLEPLAGGVAFLTVAYGPTRGFRLRHAVALDENPALLGRYARTIYTTHGRLLAVDATLRMMFVPLDGSYGDEPLPAVAAVQSAAHEIFHSAAASPSEAVVFRSRWRPELARAELAGAIVMHDGTHLRDVVLPLSVNDAGVASDGKDLYAVFTGGARPLLQKLAPGERAVPIYPFPGGSMLPLLAWTGSAFATVWEYPAHVRLVTPRGRYVESWCEENVNLRSENPRETQLVAGGGEVWLNESRALRLSRDSCPPPDGQETGAGWYPRLAWQNGTWAGFGRFVEEDASRLTFARDGGPFVRSAPFRTRAFSLNNAIAAAGGRWVVLHSSDNGVLEAVLLDEDGRPLHTLTLTELLAGNVGTALLPVSDREVLAVYTRSILEPPYYGVTRVVMRRLRIVPSTHRRGVRQ